MKYSNIGTGFPKQLLLLFFLFGIALISKNGQPLSSSVSASTPAVRTQVREDALRITYEDDNMVLNFKIKTFSTVAITKVKYATSDGSDPVELTPLTKTYDPKYFNDKTRMYTQYWSAKIYLKPGDNIFTFTSYDKNWNNSKKHNEHESEIKTRNYTYTTLMREQAQYEEFHQDEHMRALMKDSMPGHYVKDCCIGGTEWYELRKQIIQCIISKNPTAVIPEDAKRECTEGTTLLKDIKSTTKDDYYLAISHLNKANAMAPWWPQIYFELAMAHLAAQNSEYAKENFELYLLFQQTSTQVATALRELHKINEMLEAAKPQPEK